MTLNLNKAENKINRSFLDHFHDDFSTKNQYLCRKICCYQQVWEQKKMQMHFERNILFYAFEEKFRREENNLPALIYSGKFLEFVSEP